MQNQAFNHFITELASANAEFEDKRARVYKDHLEKIEALKLSINYEDVEDFDMKMEQFEDLDISHEIEQTAIKRDFQAIVNRLQNDTLYTFYSLISTDREVE